MGMRKCKWCHDWYNQKEVEVYCWSCREQGNDKKDMELKRLTELEKKNPIGKILSEGMSSKEIVNKLIELDILTDNKKITSKGMEYIQYHMSRLDSVQRIMFEIYILQYHGADVDIEYDSK